jgi:hypothetical protein
MKLKKAHLIYEKLIRRMKPKTNNKHLQKNIHIQRSKKKKKIRSDSDV